MENLTDHENVGYWKEAEFTATLMITEQKIKIMHMCWKPALTPLCCIRNNMDWSKRAKQISVPYDQENRPDKRLLILIEKWETEKQYSNKRRNFKCIRSSAYFRKIQCNLNFLWQSCILSINFRNLSDNQIIDCYTNRVDDNCQNILEGQTCSDIIDIDILNATITNLLFTSGITLRKKRKTKHAKPFWSNELTILKRETQKAYTEWKKMQADGSLIL